jgi:hypothetical protein
MFRGIRRWLLRRWLWRKFGKMALGNKQEVRAWIKQVAEDRIP